MMDIPARSWSYITLGFGMVKNGGGSSATVWKMGGYDGWLSIEHEDVLLNSLEGLEKSVDLLKKSCRWRRVISSRRRFKSLLKGWAYESILHWPPAWKCCGGSTHNGG
ncbi:MAG: hypothetical protein R3E89_18800 [Thiolinea sp.]